jgi:sec-independent protein translocase protein TatA
MLQNPEEGCLRFRCPVRGGSERESHMGNLGIQEMIVIFVIALIIFGPKKLPEIGKSLGKGIAEFKRASSDLAKAWEEEASAAKEKEATAANDEKIAPKNQDGSSV